MLPLGDNPIVGVVVQRFGAARHHLRHNRLLLRRPFDTEHVTRKVERFLDRPDKFVRRYDFVRITDRNPSGTVAPSASIVRRCAN